MSNFGDSGLGGGIGYLRDAGFPETSFERYIFRRGFGLFWLIPSAEKEFGSLVSTSR